MTDYTAATGNNGTLTLRVTQSSQDIGNNGSTDHWELYLSSSYRNTYQNSAKACQVQINGNVYNGTFTFNFNNYTDVLIMSGDTWVPHNADGTKSTAVYGYIAATGTSSIGGPASVSNTFYQSTIPRASTPTLSANPVDANTSVTIYTNRASTSFTHTIEYYFGSASGTIGAAQSVADSIAWVVPNSLMNEIPNSTSGVGTIRCHTYSSGSYIGYKDTTITINVPATIIPTISGLTAVEATAGLAANVGAFVQTLSKLTLTMSGIAYQYGASFASAKITANGQTINATSGVTPAVISASGTVAVVAEVTDSRGRKGTKTLNVTVMPYAPPTITSVTVQRALSTGVPNTPSDSGTYIRTNINASVQSLVVGTQKNAINYRISTRLHGTTTWTANTPVAPGGITFNGSKAYGTFPINSSYDVLVEVYDDFITTAQQLSVPTAAIFMHWDSTLGVGVGKYREQGTLDVLGSAYHNDGKLIMNADQSNTAFTLLGAGVNLNTLTTTGGYYQNATANATTALNYPVAIAGFLEVFGGAMLQQRYTVYGAGGGKVYVRSFYSGAFSAWRELSFAADVNATVPFIRGRLGNAVENQLSKFYSEANGGGFGVVSGVTAITVPKSGIYQINIAQLIATAAASPLYFIMLIDGNTDYHGYNPGGWMGDMRIHVSRDLTAGRQISLRTDGGGSPSSWTGPHCDFSITWLGNL